MLENKFFKKMLKKIINRNNQIKKNSRKPFKTNYNKQIEELHRHLP